ncbi:hypothetical protein H113_01457 [Trichophyton rubrum MR1459]|uniref:Uncharacterized protein n=1 Tax=Trichophyton rubrum (strain ATCC MYA-4607 / CBS 118892) TaxID=559305 RepID=A0A080WLI4_TRIRC|nr:uncharacterized protein TERG_12511 [Trichophyton rubrum CBS 118892]EZF98907.1 hypothetical protein H113_01457 [Trichophyton rubrum MR1459]EZG09965.1 hypothetical protein H106_01220 [Trichophyton rubrum CBS 735.88]KFL62584.1 hypothetical protein TERG_12511 [Trichophyton rubrum CBS 118892]
MSPLEKRVMINRRVQILTATGFARSAFDESSSLRPAISIRSCSSVESFSYPPQGNRLPRFFAQPGMTDRDRCPLPGCVSSNWKAVNIAHIIMAMPLTMFGKAYGHLSNNQVRELPGTNAFGYVLTGSLSIPPSRGPTVDPRLKAVGISNIARDSNFSPLISLTIVLITAILLLARPIKRWHATTPSKLLQNASPSQEIPVVKRLISRTFLRPTRGESTSTPKIGERKSCGMAIATLRRETWKARLAALGTEPSGSLNILS